MMVEILHETAGEAATEPAAGPSLHDPAIDADDIWITAALDWDELEGRRNVASREEAD